MQCMLVRDKNYYLDNFLPKNRDFKDRLWRRLKSFRPKIAFTIKLFKSKLPLIVIVVAQKLSFPIFPVMFELGEKK